MKLVLALALLLPGLSLAQSIAQPTGVSVTQVSPTSAKVCWAQPAVPAIGVNVFTATTDAALTAIDKAQPNTQMIGGGSVAAVLTGCYTAINLPTGLNVFDVNFWNCAATCNVSPQSAHVSITLSAAVCPVAPACPVLPPPAPPAPPTIVPPTYTVEWSCAAGSALPTITQLPITGGIAFQIVASCLPPAQ
jgi:hypothetical protein